MERIRNFAKQPRLRGPAAAAIAVDGRTSDGVRWVGLALVVSALALLLGPPPAHAQFGGPVSYTLRVVDQTGRPLDGSLIRVEGTTGDLSSPATVELNPGFQLVTVEPVVVGAMLPGGALRLTGSNGVSRNDFLFLDPTGGDVVIEWRTATASVSVVDQDGAAIPGARWGFAGDGAAYEPGDLVLPITDEALYPTMGGPSTAGWTFDVRAAFDGAAVDLVRGEQREAAEGMAPLAFEWRQTACNMGVVDAAGNPIRGATWTILGHTFAAGDAITLPTTDESLYAGLSGALAGGFTTTMFTNTASGTGDALFEVTAAGALAPAFADVNGGSFGLRCGVAPFPPLTTGTLVVHVTADGAPFPGAQVTLVDANGASSTIPTALDGSFTLTDVAQGAAQLTLAIPTGFHGVDPANGVRTTTIVAGATSDVSFEMAADTAPPPPLVNNPESANYWAREIRAALRGHGRHDESAFDMSVGFPQAIFAGFAQHPTDPVRVQGVTQFDPDGAGPKDPRRLTLAEMDATMDGASAKSSAKGELLVVLLNVVSGRLSLELIVDASGRTLAQEIRRLAALINDGNAANDALARNAAQRINAGRAGGIVPTYRKHEETAGVVAADPGAGALALRATSGARLVFTLPSAQRATLDVFDAMGRRQARLYEGTAPSGTTTVTWDGAGSRSGVYFARLVTESGMRSTKVIAAR